MARRFSDLTPSLSAASLSAVAELGFKFMTPVQATTIPLFLQHKDVCVEATTGSGKTIAFALPIFEMLSRVESPLGSHDVGAMIIAPTRELAEQIFEVCQLLGKHFEGLAPTLLVGGTSVADAITAYGTTGGQVLVGTPGRILDMCNRPNVFNLRRLEVLVLDEADKLLDMGFKESITQILGMLPKQRRTGLFSATQTKEVSELARAGLRNPVNVSVRVQQKTAAGKAAAAALGAQATPSSLDNSFLIRELDERPAELLCFLRKHLDKKIIVFVATCACVDYYSEVYHQMAKAGELLPKETQIVGFHGKMIPKKRTGLYRKFKDLPRGIMFSTDVAARGIDIPDVDLIVQLTAPKDPAFFVHRVGRTARAGKKGGALLFISPEEEPYIELLRGRGVPLVNADYAEGASSRVSPEEAKKVTDVMREMSRSDRDILESGSAAFIASIRAYKENLCAFIFRLEFLDIGSLARSYGLLRLPKIAETRGVKGKPIVFDTDPMDTSLVPYRHPEKEKARLKRLREGKAKEEADAIAAKEAANGKKNPKEAPKQWVDANEFERVDKKRDRKKRKGERAKFMDEWDEMAAEEAMFKKFKRGKLSEADYEDMLFDDNIKERATAKLAADDHVSSDSDSDCDSD